MTTGVFFHEMFTGREWLIIGDKFRNFPRAMKQVRQEFIPRAREFRPDMILHNLGHDTCQLDYGDIGLTPEFFPWLAKEIKDCANEICHGKYVILTHGGKRSDVAEYIFPRIIEILAEPGERKKV